MSASDFDLEHDVNVGEGPVKYLLVVSTNVVTRPTDLCRMLFGNGAVGFGGLIARSSYTGVPVRTILVGHGIPM